MENIEVSNNLRWIAHGLILLVIKYNSYVINECRSHTKSYDQNQNVQNSGVRLVVKKVQVSNWSKDKNFIVGDMSFYGMIKGAYVSLIIILSMLQCLDVIGLRTISVWRSMTLVLC